MNTQNNLMTANEVLLNKGLNFKVIESPIYDNQGRILENFKAIQREDNGHPFQVSKNGYKIIQNAEALSCLDDIVGSGLAKYTNAKSFKKGAIVFVQAEVPSLSDTVAGEELKAFIYCATSHDGSLALNIFAHQQRVICQNLLTRKKAGEVVRFRHTSNYRLKMDEALEVFAKYRKIFLEEKQAFQKMASVQFSALHLDSFLNSLLDISDKEDENSTRILNQKEKLERLFVHGIGHEKEGIKGTAWAAYNAITQYIDHERGSEDNREYASIFGTGQELRQKAFDLIVKNF